MKKLMLSSLLGLLLGAGAALTAGAATAPPKYIQAAVDDAARPDADRQRDADRKPAQMLVFAGVKSGNHIVELVPGGGYFTRILSAAVGARGKLYAVVPAPRAAAPAGAPDRAAPIRALAADPKYANISVLVQPVKTLDLPAQADLVWTSLNYHDIHNVPDIDLLAFNQSIFKALKPGGVYLVIDHAAAADAAPDVTSTLHRISPETVKREVLAAGFVLEAQSDLLHNADDPHTAKVFETGIRGKTDQFAFRFRKPRR